MGTCIGGSADGVGTNAQFYRPQGVTINPSGTLMYVAGYYDCNIRAIGLPSGTVK